MNAPRTVPAITAIPSRADPRSLLRVQAPLAFERLKGRRKSERRESLRGKHLLAWGLASVPEAVIRIGRLSKRGQSRGTVETVARDLRTWLDGALPATPEIDHALECLAWGHALPDLARRLELSLWSELLERLLQVCGEASALWLEADPLIHQWLAGELPLLLASYLPDVEACIDLEDGARGALSQGLVDLLDGEGLPNARQLHLLPALLACWTRCRDIGGRLKHGSWAAPAEEQYQWAIRQGLRLTRRDGTPAFSTPPANAYDAELFRAATKFVDSADRKWLDAVWPTSQAKGKPAPAADLPSPAVHSEWAETAVLRADWSPGCPRLTVTYHGTAVKMELSAGRDIVWSGDWGLQVHLDDELAQPSGSWEQICWVSDADVDYLELEAPLTGALRVQRQILLARQDNILLLADAILGREAGRLQYRSTLPLGGGIGFVQAAETREGFLEGRKYRGLVLPIGLPEWRSDPRGGKLVLTAAGLELHHSTVGRNLLAPLWIDLSPRRMLKPCTWRQLTVAESREVQPRDVAAGYRIQIGSKQWLVYRSLAQRGNRTVLGHNLATEFLAARFNTAGEVESLLEIE